MASEHKFSVGDRVRVSRMEGASNEYNDKHGVIKKCSPAFGWSVDFDDGSGYPFHARELDPLTTFWKVARNRNGVLGSVCERKGAAPAVIYVEGEEAPLCVAFATEAEARDFVSIMTNHGTLEIWRAEGVDCGAPPWELIWGGQGDLTRSCEHLMLIERVAVYREGAEVVAEPEPDALALNLDFVAKDSEIKRLRTVEGDLRDLLDEERARNTALTKEVTAAWASSMSLRAEVEGKDELLDSYRAHHKADTRLVDAAVKIVQEWDTRGCSRMATIDALKRAVKAHPSYAPAEPAPAPTPAAADPMTTPRLIRLTEMSFDGNLRGPRFLDPATIVSIGLGGGDRSKTTLIWWGRNMCTFVTESVKEVSALVDGAPASPTPTAADRVVEALCACGSANYSARALREIARPLEPKRWRARMLNATADALLAWAEENQ